MRILLSPLLLAILRAIWLVAGVQFILSHGKAADDAYQLRVAQQAAIIMGNDSHVVYEVRSNGDGTFRVVLDPRAVQTDVLQAFQQTHH